MTPDSFSDGGQFSGSKDAIDAGRRMIDEGADLLDVGGESTRPGAEPVGEEEELRRTIPVVEGLARLGLPVSIDTMKSRVANQALQSGAFLVNDVGGLQDPIMLETVAGAKCHVCIMHMRGEPRTMQAAPDYGNVTRDVRTFLVRQAVRAEEAGVHRDRIWIDPGIGFGKTVEHNLTLLKKLESFTTLGYPVLIGVSRKSFIGKVLGGLPADDRLEGTLAAQVLAQSLGARVIRAHDVRASRRAIDFAAAVMGV